MLIFWLLCCCINKMIKKLIYYFHFFLGKTHITDHMPNLYCHTQHIEVSIKIPSFVIFHKLAKCSSNFYLYITPESCRQHNVCLSDGSWVPKPPWLHYFNCKFQKKVGQACDKGWLWKNVAQSRWPYRWWRLLIFKPFIYQCSFIFLLFYSFYVVSCNCTLCFIIMVWFCCILCPKWTTMAY